MFFVEIDRHSVNLETSNIQPFTPRQNPFESHQTERAWSRKKIPPLAVQFSSMSRIILSSLGRALMLSDVGCIMG